MLSVIAMCASVVSVNNGLVFQGGFQEDYVSMDFSTSLLSATEGDMDAIMEGLLEADRLARDMTWSELSAELEACKVKFSHLNGRSIIDRIKP